jgi:beta-galactosidase
VAEVRTAGAAAAIRLTPDRDTVTSAPGDVALVRLEIVDAAGTVVPGAGDLVHVTVAGGSIVALDNADMRDHDPYRADSLRVFNGRGLAILRAAGPGVLRVAARADGLREARLTIQVVRGAASEVIPPAR